MQLRYMPSLPYVRKVCVAAREADVEDLIEYVPTDIRAKDSDIRDDNPLGKVPALTLKNGEVLFDSVVICEFLDSIKDEGKLFPPYGFERWNVLRQHAQANGVMDATWLRRREGMRAEEKQSKSQIRHQTKAIDAALDAFEKEVPEFPDDPTIGTITLGVALGYLDFRAPELNWRDGRPALTDWYEEFSARPSMQATLPRETT